MTMFTEYAIKTGLNVDCVNEAPNQLAEVTAVAEWKTIPDFPNYQVSDEGNVFNLKNNRPLLLSKRPAGYWTANLSNSGKRATIDVHRLVAQCFGLDTSQQIDHIDGDKLNNKLSNLRTVNNRQNKMAGVMKKNGCVRGYIKRRGKFMAYCRFGGKQHYLGTYLTEQEASTAYQNFLISSGLISDVSFVKSLAAQHDKETGE